MTDKEIENTQLMIDDLRWLIKGRSLPVDEQLAMVIVKCPCCLLRISRTWWLSNDKQLAEKLKHYEEKMLSETNLNDLKK